MDVTSFRNKLNMFHTIQRFRAYFFHALEYLELKNEFLSGKIIDINFPDGSEFRMSCLNGSFLLSLKLTKLQKLCYRIFGTCALKYYY